MALTATLLKPLAKSVLVLLVLMASVSATDAAVQKKTWDWGVLWTLQK